jgi:hypothetical protein
MKPGALHTPRNFEASLIRRTASELGADTRFIGLGARNTPNGATAFTAWDRLARSHG